MLRFSIVLFGALALVACEPTRKKCSNVRCEAGRVCEEATGLCVKGDGGTVKRVVDSGVKDAVASPTPGPWMRARRARPPATVGSAT